MKSKFYTFVALLATSFIGILPAMSQKSAIVTDTVLMGSGYGSEVYYSMSNGKQGTVNRKQWDIAFRCSRMSASILTNDAANNNPIGLSGVELYTYTKSDTSGWSSIDTNGMYNWKKMVNSTTDWETGAFSANQKGHPDYGWGKYNTASHDVVGESLYIIRLRDGSYRKLWIMRKYSSDNVYEFRFANIDGTGDTKIMLDCNPYSTRNFVGYSLTTNQVVDFEPVANTQWDILFAKYIYTYPDGVQYPVTGVLSNYGIKVNRFHPVAPDYRMFDLESMDSTRSPIGWEWKYLDPSFIYHVEDSLVHFIQDKNKNIYKLVFTEFAGSSTGRIVFQKEMISAAGINESVKSDLNVAIYPNPVNNVMNLVINPGKSVEVLVSLIDLSGHMLINQHFNLQSETLSTLQVPVKTVPSGVYIVKIQAASNVFTRKVVINN
jgi:hypothetical protein